LRLGWIVKNKLHEQNYRPWTSTILIIWLSLLICDCKSSKSVQQVKSWSRKSPLHVVSLHHGTETALLHICKLRHHYVEWFLFNCSIGLALKLLWMVSWVWWILVSDCVPSWMVQVLSRILLLVVMPYCNSICIMDWKW
jgi:hypothetical protein